MLDAVVGIYVILLSTIVVLLVLLLAMAVGIFRRLSRMEKHLGAGTSQQVAGEPSPTLADASAGGAFETFLNENAERRSLSKSEQFAAYRRWRQENGMNWSNG